MSNEQPTGSKDRSVTRSAFSVMVGSLVAMVAGLANQMVLAAVFGTSAEMDAYLTALVVPTYLQAVLLAGLPFVLIPAFVREDSAGSEGDAWSLAGTFFWLTAGLLTLVAVGGSLLASQILALSAPGLSPGKADLAAQMLSVLMFVVPLTGLGSLTMGVQNARGRFFWPSVATGLGSIGNLVVVLVAYRTLGAVALAWGYLTHEVLRVSVTTLPVLRHGWDRLLPLRDPRVRELGKLMIPFVAFGLLTRSMPVLERFFASGLPDGDLSYLGYGAKIGNIVMGLLGAGIITAMFPAMARAYAQTGERGLVEQAGYGIRLTMAIGLPCVAVLSGVAVPLVSVLFERGAFGPAATLNVSRIMPAVITGTVLCPMVGNLLTRVYYVTKDTHTVPIVSSAAIVVYVFLAKGLADAQGYVGLALAQALYQVLAIIVLYALLLRKLRSLPRRMLLASLLRYGALSAIAFGAAWLMSQGLRSLPALPRLLAALLAGGGLYLGILASVDRDVAISILEMTGAQRILRILRAAVTALQGRWHVARRRWRRLQWRYVGGDAGPHPDAGSGRLNVLVIVAFATDLFVQFLIWKGVMPAPVRWLSHLAVALLMAGALVRMLVRNRIPPIVLVIIGLSLISVTAAVLQGQGVVPTVWGWWVMFQFPLVGLYLYLQPRWPSHLARHLRRTLAALLVLQVGVQAAQYVTGETPGDNLAGTFGAHGTGPLVLFALFALCLALGQWLARREWRTLAPVLVFGGLASVLGEMKLFPFAVAALAGLALAIYLLQGGHFGRIFRLVPYGLLLFAVGFLFVQAYNAVVPSATVRPVQTYLQLDRIEEYLGFMRERDTEAGSGAYYGRAEVGRNYALSYGWKTIRQDPMTLLFGLGIGARGESRTLGSAGQGLIQGELGLTTGTSLLVMMQEFGLSGLLVLGAFWVWVMARLVKDIRKAPASEVAELRYGLLLFSALWPVWMWYQHVWLNRVPMLLYWAALGYALSEAQQCWTDRPAAAPGISARLQTVGEVR
jgi:putative peptidoglycan lipid II flippase